MTALSLSEQNPSSRNDRRWRSPGNGQEVEAPPLAKIPCHESNGINGSSIGGLSVNLWQVAGHLQIPFRDTWWTWARCAKNLTERQFWILSTPASVFGHGKYGNANRTATIRSFPALALVGVTALSPTERNPSSRNDRRRRSPGNGQEGEAPP